MRVPEYSQVSIIERHKAAKEAIHAVAKNVNTKQTQKRDSVEHGQGLRRFRLVFKG